MPTSLTIDFKFKPGDRVRIFKSGKCLNKTGEVGMLWMRGSIDDQNIACVIITYLVKVDGDTQYRQFREELLELE